MSTPGPVLGPCEAWIDADDVAACCPPPDGSDSSVYDALAIEASMALFEISGRQFTGLCDRTVRPCRDGCGCWGSPSLGLGPWAWSAAAWGYGSGYAWFNECGDRCGCGSLSRIRLSGYPVREITEVKIDGDALAETDDGNLNWRLDGWRWLTRMDSPGPPVVKRAWPACQNLALADTEAGTFSVSYRSGVDPPELGREAAAALACQLYKSCPSVGGDCAIPTGTAKITRQGVTVDRGLLANWFDPKKSTGIAKLDLFLRAYWSGRSGRRPAVYSPDVQPFAREIG
jgi:hypothetical protein